MGAIARNIANNITTSGVFTPSALNSSSVTGITVLANASDGITFISSQTASNSASISFTSGLTSTYKAYRFLFSNCHPRTDNVNFTFNLSIDGGSNYNVTKTGTMLLAYHSEGDLSGLDYESAVDLNQSTAFGQLSGGTGNGADESCSGYFTLFNPSSTTYVKQYIGVINDYQVNDYSMNRFVTGYANTTSAVNAIRFQMSSGNFDGTIYMYGIK